MNPHLWTIGHSTRPIEEFVDLLKAHGIERLVDVRTVPKSRHNPQFNTDQLAKSLKKSGLTYVHMPPLGGLRKAKRDSMNLGWRNASFRGYADYMQTEEFWRALDEFALSAKETRTTVMCAEAVPWRCHRSMIADALVSRGWTVKHIMSLTKADDHALTSFAVIEHNRIIYPAASDPDAPRLF